MTHPLRKCPLCHQQSQRLFFPFCSKKCQSIDLCKWLNADYAIASEPIQESDQEKNYEEMEDE